MKWKHIASSKNPTNQANSPNWCPLYEKLLHEANNRCTFYELHNPTDCDE